MNRKIQTYLICAASLLLLFVLFTILVACCDVRPIGVEDGGVGLAGINRFVFEAVGVHPVWYGVTEWLGVGAILVACVFGAEGLYQLLRRRQICRVDRRLWVLAGLYILVAASYLLFEKMAIHCRPILLGAGPEPSYPSSHVLLVVCVMGSAAMQLRAKLPARRKLCVWADTSAVVVSATTVIGRLLSGVHWFADVVGSLLLSAALLTMHRAALEMVLPFSVISYTASNRYS